MKGVLTPGRYARIWLLGVLGVSLVLGAGLLLGPEPGWPSSQEVLFLRFYRLLTAGLVGSALAASGVLLQALLKNPLADSYLLGLSSGSSVAIMLWLLLGRLCGAALPPWLNNWISSGGLGLPALLGALGSVMVVFSLARRQGRLDPAMLLLVGVIINAINGALLMLLNALAPHGLRADLSAYLMGYLREDLSGHHLAMGVGFLLLGWVPSLLISSALNLATGSDLEARSLGLPLEKLRLICFLSASLLTALAIDLAGPIGFVGLICPHVCRRLWGADHRQLMVSAPLLGAVFLMLADSLVRSSGRWFNGDLPVGVLTALCGGPFFLFLLRRIGPGGSL